MRPGHNLNRKFWVAAGLATAAWFILTGACGTEGTYSRVTADSADNGPPDGRIDGPVGDAVVIVDRGTGGSGGGSGGIFGGTGGMPSASTGGTTGSGGSGSGGAGVGAVMGSGGVATGGSIGSGGRGTGGSAAGSGGVSGIGGALGSGGSGTGGVAGTGGAGTGGAGTGGTGTGGAGTGGAGTGGAGTGGAGTGGASPQILSIDFVGAIVTGTGGNRVATPVPMAPTEIAGFKPAANWNSAAGAMGTLAGLVLANGTPTTASATWNAPFLATSFGIYFVGLTDAPGNARMMNGYLDPSLGTAPMSTTTVSGLSFAGGYDVYVYFLGGLGTLAAGQTRSHRLAIGAAGFTVSQAAPSPTAFAGFTEATATAGNYVVFRNVTGASFTLTSTAVSGSTLRAPVNGIQIVWPSGS